MAKVGELMALCDRLEAQLDDTTDKSQRYAEAATHAIAGMQVA